MSATFSMALLALFCTARRRNGFAAMHDLVTRTRVIARAALPSRPELAMSEMPPPAASAAGRSARIMSWKRWRNPQTCNGCWATTCVCCARCGFAWWRREHRRCRAPLRNMGRVGRLRWLTGRRSPEENWDAFEAASGRPLLSLIQIGQPWRQVRFWFFDLANEISLAEKDGTLPQVLALDRVWITADGRAKLLDFPAPGTTSNQPLTPFLSPSEGERVADRPGEGNSPDASFSTLPLPTRTTQQFLHDVATEALAGLASVADQPLGDARLRLPVHAHSFLQSLTALPDAPAVARGVAAIVAPGRRGLATAPRRHRGGLSRVSHRGHRRDVIRCVDARTLECAQSRRNGVEHAAAPARRYEFPLGEEPAASHRPSVRHLHRAPLQRGSSRTTRAGPTCFRCR